MNRSWRGLFVLAAAAALSGCASDGGSGGGGGGTYASHLEVTEGGVVHLPIAKCFDGVTDDLILMVAEKNYVYGAGWALSLPPGEKTDFEDLKNALTYALGPGYAAPGRQAPPNPAPLAPGSDPALHVLVLAVRDVLVGDKASGWHYDSNRPGWITRDPAGGANPVIGEIQKARVLRILLREALDM